VSLQPGPLTEITGVPLRDAAAGGTATGGVLAAAAAINELQDPGFESGILNHELRFVAPGVKDATAVASTPTISGNYSLIVAQSADTSTGEPTKTTVGWHAAAADGQVWSASCAAGLVTPGFRAALSITFLDITGGVLTTQTVSTTSIEPVRLDLKGIPAPAAAARVRYGLSLIETASNGNVAARAVFDDRILCRGTLPGEWFDGHTPGAEYETVAYWSRSRLRGESATFQQIKTWIPPFMYQ
jgi:hypothetical protein